MTDPQVTQADWERASVALKQAMWPSTAQHVWDAIISRDLPLPDGTEAFEREQLARAVDAFALELAKVRQQGDEAVAAVVEECSNRAETIAAHWKAEGFDSAGGRNTPEDANSNRSLYAGAKESAAAIRALKPNAQQIPAERDKRVREQRDLGWKTAFGAEDLENATQGDVAEWYWRQAEIRTEARMREPSPCEVEGHVLANYVKCPMCLGEGGSFASGSRHKDKNAGEFLQCKYCENGMSCTICAQQRELREYVEKIAGFMPNAALEQRLKCGPQPSFWWELVDEARRLSGENL